MKEQKETSRDLFEWDGTIITRYIGEETDVVIPDGTTEIGEGAFWGRIFLKSVALPDSVTKIGTCAFSCCDALTSVAIPEGVARIEKYAFFNSAYSPW